MAHDLDSVPRKKRAEFPKNAPSAATVLGEIDTIYRQWPPELIDILKHPASMTPDVYRRARPQPEPEVKIHATPVEEDDEMAALRRELEQRQRAWDRMHRDQGLLQYSLGLERAKKSNFELVKLMSMPALARSREENRFVEKHMEHEAREEANPLLRGKARPFTVMPLLRTSQKVDGKRQFAEKRSGAVMPIDTDVAPWQRRKARDVRAGGFPMLQQHADRSIHAGRAAGDNIRITEKHMSTVRQAVAETTQLLASRR
jgi:hypothetical protein